MARDWRKDLLQKMQLPVTKNNLKFLASWQRWEGGHTNNQATWNWLNTTHGTVGVAGVINRYGVKKFKNYDAGIQATIETLMNGRYDDIVSALGHGNPYKFDVRSGLSTWVSGSPKGNIDYANRVLGAKVYPTTERARRKVQAIKTRPLGIPPNSNWDWTMNFVFDDDPEWLELMRGMDDFQYQKAGVVSPGGSLKPINMNEGVNQQLISAAQSQLGKPYKFGSGPSTESFDCSDLIQWAYGQIGINLPRTTFDQIKVGRDVTGSKLVPGDLIFPHSGHVVMYVGGGKVIAAPHTGTVVQYQDVSKFKNPIAVRRIINN